MQALSEVSTQVLRVGTLHAQFTACLLASPILLPGIRLSEQKCPLRTANAVTCAHIKTIIL